MATGINVKNENFRRRPIPHHVVGVEQWERAAGDAATGTLDLMGLWADSNTVHMALRDPAAQRVGIVSYEIVGGSYPAVSRIHVAAQRLERAISDLHGLEPEGAIDVRPWLDHGQWGLTHPLGKAAPSQEVAPYDFLPVEGESLHQVPVGPVHAGIIEPGHFRFTAQGETVVRLEERLGYVHKGIDALMRGATITRGAELAGRVSGDSTVAYAWAYAQAVESALEIDVPQRALWLRALMAELERLANHLGDIGAICNDAAFAIMLAQCGVLREQVLRTAEKCFGHRFMRDLVVPGGVGQDIREDGKATIAELLRTISDQFSPLVDLYDNTASLLDRTVGTGQLDPELARRFGAGGFVGRASGRDFDVRRDFPYAPYDEMTLMVPSRSDGDVNARIWIRIEEVRQSLILIEQCLDKLPSGSIHAPLPRRRTAREGLGLVEGFRGDVLAWIAIDAGGKITRCHLRDPSWFQWPLLEAVIENNIIADFPLCNKSFNCSYSGHDL